MHYYIVYFLCGNSCLWVLNRTVRSPNVLGMFCETANTLAIHIYIFGGGVKAPVVQVSQRKRSEVKKMTPTLRCLILFVTFFNNMKLNP